MDDFFHVPAVAKGEAAANLCFTLLFAAFAGGEVAVGLPWAALFFVASALGSGWSVWRARRLARRGVVFDAGGLGPAEDGVRLWTLPWSEYAGLRRSPATLWERFRWPERDGYEILARGGGPRLFVQLPRGNRTIPAVAAARQELRRHLPVGASDPFAPVVREPRGWVVGVGLLVAMAGGVCAWFGLANPLSPYAVLGLFGAFAGTGGAATALIETASLVRWRRGWRPKPVAVPADPEEGPRLAIHAVRHAAAPIRMEEGRRYRTVEPERTRDDLRYSARVMRGMAFLFGAVALLLLILVLLDPRHDPIGIVFTLGMVGSALLCAHAVGGYRRRAATSDDVLWVHDGRLIVVRPEGEPLDLSLPIASDREALRRKALVGVTDVWRLPRGGRYAIDRTRLYAAPSDLEA